MHTGFYRKGIPTVTSASCYSKGLGCYRKEEQQLDFHMSFCFLCSRIFHFKISNKNETDMVGYVETK